MDNFNDANVQGREASVPLTIQTANEEFNIVYDTLLMERQEEMEDISEKGTSIAGELNAPFNHATRSSRSQIGEDTSDIISRARSKNQELKSNVVTYSELTKKRPSMAKKVSDYYNDPRSNGLVHLCGLFLDGECNYMSKYSRYVLNHMKNHKSNISMVKIADYPVRTDSIIQECLTKTYYDLKRHHPELAKKVLNLYNDRKKKCKSNIYLCGLYLQGKCEYISYLSTKAKLHMARNHPFCPVLIVKIVDYPKSNQKDFVAIHTELNERQPDRAEKALDLSMSIIA